MSYHLLDARAASDAHVLPDARVRHAADSMPMVSLDRPIRKDEIVVESRGIFIESWLPERRSRHRPLYFIHGELAGSWVWERYLAYFAQRGWEGHAVNLRAHYWSEPAEISTLDFDSYAEDVLVGLVQVSPPAILVGHGLGGLLALKVAEVEPVGAIVLLSPALPSQLRTPPRTHVLREIPEAFGREFVGWQAMPEQLRRRMPDLTIEDVLRIQHLMGRESGAAHRAVLTGVSIDRERFAGTPILVVGAGLDRWFPELESEILAGWIDAAYEPFGAHSHYGLVIGARGYCQVADTIRSFLESRRL